jgi:Arylsulfatase regulator (Fe-S oxidoreductase)
VYQRIFIDDLINISKDVKEIQIQGGEPTIMDQYQYYFNMLNSKNYSKNINLLITTNATNINQRFYKSLQNFKSVRMSVSIDAFGQANDYIRWPSKFKSIEKNIRSMVNYENFSQVEIFNTINILSMFNYKEFLLWCKDIESFYKEQQKNLVIIPWKVEKPIWYSPFIANNNLKEHFISEVRAFIQKNTLSSQNWKTQMLLFLKALNKSIANDSANKQFLYKIKHLDKQRNTKIQDFIPNFYDFYEKSQ